MAKALKPPPVNRFPASCGRVQTAGYPFRTSFSTAPDGWTHEERLQISFTLLDSRSTSFAFAALAGRSLDRSVSSCSSWAVLHRSSNSASRRSKSILYLGSPTILREID
jgi:hypothetical protein